MKRGSKLSALRSSEAADFLIDLDGDLFISIFRDGQSEAIGFWIPGGLLGDEKALSLIRSGAGMLGARTSELYLKAVGETAVVEKFKSSFDVQTWRKVELRPRNGPQELIFSPGSGRIRVAPAIATPTKEKIKVLIVDDSKTIRQLLEKILCADPMFEIIGSFELPSQVLEALPRLCPDVITLDIHMPEMDGIALLRRYLPRHPIPTVMISSISLEEGPLVLSALEAGAVDYIQKPSFDQLSQVAPILIEKIKSAALATVRLPSADESRVVRSPAKKSIARAGSGGQTEAILAIGSSTGGTEALREVLTALPTEIPPILICQHIPAVFSKAFAVRMDGLCPFEVKEAEDRDEVLPNRVLIAPGGTQMKMVRDGSGYRVRVDPTAEPVNRHKPSVDYLFDSVAALAGSNAVGVILTGMGADGAKGLLRMREAGSRTIGQDEATCVIYGMPQVAFKLGAVEEQLPLGKISHSAMSLISRIRARVQGKAS